MKKYIRAAEISRDIVLEARDFAESSGDSRGTIVDIPNHTIVITFGSGITEDMVFAEGIGVGDWFLKNGFNVTSEIKDVPYLTKGTFNTRGMRRDGAGAERVLRNRLVLTVTW